MTANDLFAHLGIVALAYVVIVPGVRTADIATTICIIGALSSVVITLVAYLLAWRKTDSPRLPLRDWIPQHGILFVMSQIPIAPFYYPLFPQVPPGVAVLWAIASLGLVFIWIAYRKTDEVRPEEPVHHLSRYMLYALVPCLIFSVAQIPAQVHFGLAFGGLHHLPLLSSALLFTVDGLALSIGYYVLFQRHSLINAILYVSCVFCFASSAHHLSSHPLQVVVSYWAHLALAVVMFAMPIVFRHLWRYLHIAGARVTS